MYSTTSWPGRSRPSASAASIIASAIRSLYDPVGLAASSFTHTSAPPSPAIRVSRTTGVSPIADNPPGRSIRHLPHDRASASLRPPQAPGYQRRLNWAAALRQLAGVLPEDGHSVVFLGLAHSTLLGLDRLRPGPAPRRLPLRGIRVLLADKSALEWARRDRWPR